MRLLLVEDDTLLGDGVRAGLTQQGYAVDWVEHAEAAQLALETGEYDLLILDLGLPGMPGLEFLTRLREAGEDLPVLILTARDAVSDRITGLDSGADGSITKSPWRMTGAAAAPRRSSATAIW